MDKINDTVSNETIENENIEAELDAFEKALISGNFLKAIKIEEVLGHKAVVERIFNLSEEGKERYFAYCRHIAIFFSLEKFEAYTKTLSDSSLFIHEMRRVISEFAEKDKNHPVVMKVRDVLKDVFQKEV